LITLAVSQKEINKTGSGAKQMGESLRGRGVGLAYERDRDARRKIRI